MSTENELSGLSVEETNSQNNSDTANQLEILSIENRIIEKAEPILKLLKNYNQIINGQWDLDLLSLNYYSAVIGDLNRIKNLTSENNVHYKSNANYIAKLLIDCAQKEGKEHPRFSEVLSLAKTLASEKVEKQFKEIKEPSVNEVKKEPVKVTPEIINNHTKQESVQSTQQRPSKEKGGSAFNKILMIIVVIAIIAGWLYIKKENSLYQKACELNIGLACNNLGYNYQNGLGMPIDINKANSLYQKACDLDFGTGCYNLGYSYENGLGLSEDINKAKSLYGKACRLGLNDGCTHKINDPKKNVIVNNTCSKGDECLDKALQYEKAGYIIKANALYQKACDFNEGQGCFNLGYNYKYGIGLSKDINKAKSLYYKACRIGVKQACNY